VSNGTVANGSTLQATGEFVSPITSELAAKIQGRVTRVYVQEGERVSAGQALLTLDTDYSNLDLQRAQAEQARAAAMEAEAERDIARKRDLLAKGSVPQATYDRSQAAVEQARAARAAAAAQVGSARQRLADSTLRAPINGVVVEKRAEVGERLGDNSVAFVIAQTSPLKLRFDLPERYLESVRKGQTVRATTEPFPNEKFEGKVSVIAQVVDPKTRSFFVEALFPNTDRRLRPGLFARVELDAK
jgi:RND family efflux transporter MFP subunit